MMKKILRFLTGNPKIIAGDMVTSDHKYLRQYFKGRPVKVERVRYVNGCEGDAVKCEGIDIEFWSDYLTRV